MTADPYTMLIYAAFALAGYLLKHYGVNLPFLPGGPPAAPAVAPANAPVLEKVVNELKQHLADVEHAAMKSKLIQTVIEKPAK